MMHPFPTMSRRMRAARVNLVGSAIKKELSSIMKLEQNRTSDEQGGDNHVPFRI
jgi:hypothetical protein